MTNKVMEYGDFQTPPDLARRICALLARQGFEPASVLEPTCGVGAFLEEAASVWPHATLQGVDINEEYVETANKRLNGRATITQGDFFQHDWKNVLSRMEEPIAVVGNLPWVTNAKVGLLGGSNLPQKSNFQGFKGLGAMTGKSNFDISEWMLLQMLEWPSMQRVLLALLCKTAVARKVLTHAWKRGLNLSSAIHVIDAQKEFNVNVDACLLIAEFSSKAKLDCAIHAHLGEKRPRQTIGYRDSHLVAEVSRYPLCRGLIGHSHFKWRSGIKHDCSKVMELEREDQASLVNGLGETVELEPDCLFPMLKSSCIANGRITNPSKWMLVPQQAVNEPTHHLAHIAPKTWNYLVKHKALLDKRGSSIYKQRPPFSIFGIGPYSFAPWKVAISGFYHSLEFRMLGSHLGKPIVVDDTINFIPCKTRAGAEVILRLLNSEEANAFFNTFVFWDSKRPLTTEILQKLNIVALADRLGEVIPAQEFPQTHSARMTRLG